MTTYCIQKCVSPRSTSTAACCSSTEQSPKTVHHHKAANALTVDCCSVVKLYNKRYASAVVKVSWQPQVEPHVNADPERILAATAASSAQQTADTAAFAPVHGYTTETLLKDKRFKVRAVQTL